MKILLVNSFYYNRGGDCTYLFSLKKLLEEKGHKVSVFSMHHPQNFDSEYSKYFVSYINYDEEIKNLNIKSWIKVLSRTIHSQEAAKKIENLVKKEKPDIAHLQNVHHHLTPSIFYVLKRHKIPIVWTLHDYTVICPNTSFLSHGKICERCKRRKYFWPSIVRCKKDSFAASTMAAIETTIHRITRVNNLVDVFITPSEFLRNKLIDYGFKKDKVICLNNFIDIDIDLCNEKEDADDYYLYVGRISEEKGIKTLIDAAIKVSSCKLKIIGGGPLQEKLLLYAQSEDKNRVIEFLGHKHHDEVIKLIKNCHFVVVSSEWYENYPYAILEAFACGKPIIGSKLGGIPELIGDTERGLIFEPANSDDLSAKIKYLLNKPDIAKKMGENARTFVEQKLNAEKHYEKVIEIYERAISKKFSVQQEEKKHKVNVFSMHHPEKFSIVLINPRYERSFQPPLGLAYLAAYLKKQKHLDVQIIDTAFEQLGKRLAKITRPSLFGIYIMTPYYNRAYKTVEILKKRFPGIPIVAGGPHCTINPDSVLNDMQIPICVRGEGEYTFSELVNTIKDGLDLSKVYGISYMDPKRNQIVHTPNRKPIPDLDDLPFPSRELLPMRKYVSRGTQKPFLYRNIRATTIMTTRGCPFNCTYCQPTLDKIFGKKVRFRSVDNVIEEIAQLINDYSIQGIFIIDDTFTFRKSFVLQFCEEIIRRKFNIKFAINSRVDTIDEEILVSLKKAGVITILYGIESGNQKVLDNIKKKTTIEQIRKTVIATKNKGINVYGYFMIGSPEESISSLKDTFSLAKKLPFDEIQFSMATPYEGTYLHDEACSLNLITNLSVMRRGGYFTSNVMKSRYLSSEEIIKYHRRFMRFSRYKSIKNIILNHPTSLLFLFFNRFLPNWFKRF